MGRSTSGIREINQTLLLVALALASAFSLCGGRYATAGAARPAEASTAGVSVHPLPASTLETAWTFQLPRNDFQAGSYGNRNFLSPANHLGEDSAHPHYAPVYAIANGVVKVAQPAQGYGRAVVIEHRLPDGNFVTSIYGHLCGHSGYPLIPNGSYVTKGQLIGYIGSDIENGDGAEHLHLGIRIGRYDGYFCGYTGISQCTASRYYRPTEFINARRNGLAVTSGILLSPSSPVVNNPITFTAGLRNNHYYGGSFAFRLRVTTGSVVTLSPEQTRWLNPGDSATLTFTATPRSAGTYQATLELRAPGTETWWPIAVSSSGINPRFFTVTNGDPTGGAPAPPSNLTAITDSELRAILFWNDNSSNETGFKIERKLGASGSWSQIATLGAGATGYVNTGLSPSTSYVYRVRATNASGDSAYSNEAAINTVGGSCSSSTYTITPGRPLTGSLSPTDCYSSVRTSSYYDRFAFTATGGLAYTITMTSASFDTYLVLKNASGTLLATNDDADGTNSRIVYTPTSSGTYVIEATSYPSRVTGSYTVSLSGSGGSSGVPAAPSNLSATTDSALRALLFWNDNSSNETGFKIERKLGASGSWSQIATLGAGATGYANTGLSPSTNYVYRVRATNASGDSAYFNEAAITTVGGSCSSSTYTITPGQSLAGNLSSTDCFSSVRTSSYYDRFAFTATGGVPYTITMTSASFDTYLVLKNASGTVLATNDDADGINSRIIYTATTSGTYVIEATSYMSRATGAFTVSLSTR